MNDRVSSMPYKHQSLAFGYRFDAARRAFVPATKRLIAFDRGIDDTERDPWRNAGYSTKDVPSNSVGITNTYRGGAFSIDDTVMILGVSLVPGRIVRIVAASDVVADATTPMFPRGGGTVLTDNVDVADLHGFLFDSLLHGGEAELLPPGDGSMAGSCSMYVGPTRFMRGTSDGSFVWRPHEACFCEANVRNMGGFTPNRMQFTFRDAVGAVPLIDGVAAPSDGDYAVVEFDVRVDVARVKFDRDTRGNVAYSGIDEIGRSKIASWKETIGGASR